MYWRGNACIAKAQQKQLLRGGTGRINNNRAATVVGSSKSPGAVQSGAGNVVGHQDWLATTQLPPCQRLS